MEKEKKRAIFSLIRVVFSLVATFFLLFSLIEHISAIQGGEVDNNTIILILFESLGLFLLPFLLPRSKKQMKKQNKKQQDLDSKYDEKFKKKIAKRVKLNSNYQPAIIKKCNYCKFENPAKTEKCLNCGKTLY